MRTMKRKRGRMNPTILFMLLLYASCQIVDAQCGTRPSRDKRPVIFVAAETTQTEARVGAPITIRATRTNISDHAISVWSDKLGQNYFIAVTKDDGTTAKDKRPGYKGGVPDPGSPDLVHRGISGACITLKPGESQTDSIELTAVFDIRQTGRYSVVLMASDPESLDDLKSTPLSIVVTR
jgi:hypothetical protein